MKKTAILAAAILALSFTQSKASESIEAQKAAAGNFSLPSARVLIKEAAANTIYGDAPIKSWMPINLQGLDIGVTFVTEPPQTPPPCHEEPYYEGSYQKICSWEDVPGRDDSGNVITRDVSDIMVESGDNADGSRNENENAYVWWPTEAALRRHGYALVLSGKTLVLEKTNGSDATALGTLKASGAVSTSLIVDKGLRMSVRGGPAIRCLSIRGRRVPHGRYAENIITLWNVRDHHGATFVTLPAWYDGWYLGGEHSAWPSECRP
ncbi:MAG TPA: hypothetical protein VNH15_06005 [Elusimicrobiota bacterium]|nr:hypothetical protein [Elusimicrobiota bacterium]